MKDNSTKKCLPTVPEVFISYSSWNRDRVIKIADTLREEGVNLWLDRDKIPGGTNWSKEIVRAIKNCRLMILMCSDASVRSRNVKAEIQLAWKYEKLYLPLMLEPISFPEQIEYFLEGWQWIEVANQPEEQWLPKVFNALRNIGIHVKGSGAASAESGDLVQPKRIAKGLSSLRAIAKFTDRIWPVPSGAMTPQTLTASTRGLGAPQEDVQHGFPLGSRVQLIIESDREGHLTLLDEGPEGLIYCLCPSWFAPETRLVPGKNLLPQPAARYNSFMLTGKPGREQLLALITDTPFNLDWIPADPKTPARVLGQKDTDTLLAKLRNLESTQWVALSTYFDVLA